MCLYANYWSSTEIPLKNNQERRKARKIGQRPTRTKTATQNLVQNVWKPLESRKETVPKRGRKYLGTKFIMDLNKFTFLLIILLIRTEKLINMLWSRKLCSWGMF